MNREDLLNKIMTLETNMERLQKDFIELKQLSVQLVEENVTLQMERDALKNMVEPEKTPTKKRVNSKENLAQLYAEGFHICGGSSGLFGKHRNGEDCMFCLQVLNSD